MYNWFNENSSFSVHSLNMNKLYPSLSPQVASGRKHTISKRSVLMSSFLNSVPERMSDLQYR